MDRDDIELYYDGQPVLDYINQDVPRAEHDFLVYVMGPYTAFNAEYVYDNADELKSSYIDDPLFDPNQHVVDNKGSYEKALSDFCSNLRSQLDVRAFIATDVNIPTKKEVKEQDLPEPGMTPADQSVEFAIISDAVIFIFSQAGLTTGVGKEAGAILGEFNLRKRNPKKANKPPARLRIFKGPEFKSATVEEVEPAYGVDDFCFEDVDELIENVEQFLVNIERKDREDNFPLFRPYEEDK